MVAPHRKRFRDTNVVFSIWNAAFQKIWVNLKFGKTDNSPPNASPYGRAAARLYIYIYIYGYLGYLLSNGAIIEENNVSPTCPDGDATPLCEMYFPFSSKIPTLDPENFVSEFVYLKATPDFLVSELHWVTTILLGKYLV